MEILEWISDEEFQRIMDERESIDHPRFCQKIFSYIVLLLNSSHLAVLMMMSIQKCLEKYSG